MGKVGHASGRLVAEIFVDECDAQHGPCVSILQEFEENSEEVQTWISAFGWNAWSNAMAKDTLIDE